MYCVNKEENARSNKENERDRFNTLNIKEKGELEFTWNNEQKERRE